MDAAFGFPKKCRMAIHILMDRIGMSADIAYHSLLMAAALHDLRPEDEQTVQIILQDCGVEVE